MPSSVYELPPREKNKDDPNRKDEWLIEAIPKDRRKVYKARKIINTLVDNGSFLEFANSYLYSEIIGVKGQ